VLPNAVWRRDAKSDSQELLRPIGAPSPNKSRKRSRLGLQLRFADPEDDDPDHALEANRVREVDVERQKHPHV
jgi:hypothetical protein